MHLIAHPVHIFPCSNSAMKGNDGTNRIPRYCCQNHNRTFTVFHCWNQAFRIVGFFGRSPNTNSSWCREQREGWLIWPYHVHVSSCLMSRSYGHDTIVYAFEHYFQKFSNCSPTLDVGFVKLTSDSFCWNRVFKMNILFCCRVICATVVTWFFLETILLNVRQSLSVNVDLSPTVPLRWYLPIICVCRHNLRNCRSQYTKQWGSFCDRCSS
jgi:hypothetical protein